MARAPENPDRNFSADGDAEEDFAALRHTLDLGKPALPYNEAAKLRFGKVITDAVLPARVRPPVRRVGAKGGGAL
jgi:hypothetical protein